MAHKLLTITGQGVPAEEGQSAAEAVRELELRSGEPFLRFIGPDGSRHPMSDLQRIDELEGPLLLIPGCPAGPLKAMSVADEETVGATAEALSPSAAAAAIGRWRAQRRQAGIGSPLAKAAAGCPPPDEGDGVTPRRMNAFLRLLLRDDLLQVFDEVVSERREVSEQGADYDSCLEGLAPVPEELLASLTQMGFPDAHAKRALWLAHMDTQLALNLLLEGAVGERELTEAEFRQARRQLRGRRRRETVDEMQAGPCPDPVLASVLQDMGFCDARVRRALRRALNDFERALMLLVTDALQVRQSDGRRQQLGDAIEGALDESGIACGAARAVLCELIRNPQACPVVMRSAETGAFICGLEHRLTDPAGS